MAIDEKRLAELRVAAEVGMRMSSLQPHTIHVRPDELAALVEEAFIARAQERPRADIACRTCGCTDSDCSGCIERTGVPCFWIERDLCSACSDSPADRLTADVLARGIALRHHSPGAFIMMLDVAGGLHLGCAAVDDPITSRFVALARSVNIGIERGADGFGGLTRDQAIEIARRCAAVKPQSYYAEPFEPHGWVVDAILQASSSLPPATARCSHCGHEVDEAAVAATREHVLTCDKNPLVQEVERLRAITTQALATSRRWLDDNTVEHQFGVGTFDSEMSHLASLLIPGDPCRCPNCGGELEQDETGPIGCPECAWSNGQPVATRGELLSRIDGLELQVREQRPLVDQAEVVARHWDAQEGINGAELDKLRDIVFDGPEAT